MFHAPRLRAYGSLMSHERTIHTHVDTRIHTIMCRHFHTHTHGHTSFARSLSTFEDQGAWGVSTKTDHLGKTSRFCHVLQEDIVGFVQASASALVRYPLCKPRRGAVQVSLSSCKTAIEDVEETSALLSLELDRFTIAFYNVFATRRILWEMMHVTR